MTSGNVCRLHHETRPTLSDRAARRPSGEQTLYVSSVFPWISASGAPWEGESSHSRTLAALEDLKPFLFGAQDLVWGGDWNHTLEGTVTGSTKKGRQRQQEMTRELSLSVPTSRLPRGTYELPGRIFIEINKKVGFRLVTKGETTGIINMGKLIPLAGGPIGATIDVVSMRAVGRYARKNFAAHAEPR